MSRGPVVVMVVEGPEDTFAVVRTLMGTTDPTKADTDEGGLSDGEEDPNGNGAVDEGESSISNLCRIRVARSRFPVLHAV